MRCPVYLVLAYAYSYETIITIKNMNVTITSKSFLISLTIPLPCSSYPLPSPATGEWLSVSVDLFAFSRTSYNWTYSFIHWEPTCLTEWGCNDLIPSLLSSWHLMTPSDLADFLIKENPGEIGGPEHLKRDHWHDMYLQLYHLNGKNPWIVF